MMLVLAMQFSRAGWPQCPGPREVTGVRRAAEPAAGMAAGAPSKRNRRRKPVVNSGVDLVRRGHRLLRKEVIQPHLPVRLPCYDFTPIASPTFDGSLHKG